MTTVSIFDKENPTAREVANYFCMPIGYVEYFNCDPVAVSKAIQKNIGWNQIQKKIAKVGA